VKPFQDMWNRLFGPSPGVQTALRESLERRDEAHRIRTEVAEQMRPVRQALRENGFQPAVRATFQRRHA
jgi:hypothetical protein